jgi:hypothetical protein
VWLIIDGLFASRPQLELTVSNRLVMGMLLMNKGRSPCWAMDLFAEGGGKLAHIGWNRTYPAKRQKMSRKMFEHFCHVKMFRWGRTFF